MLSPLEALALTLAARLWVRLATLADCPTDYTPTDAVIDGVAVVFNRLALLDRSQRKKP